MNDEGKFDPIERDMSADLRSGSDSSSFTPVRFPRVVPAI